MSDPKGPEGEDPKVTDPKVTGTESTIQNHQALNPKVLLIGHVNRAFEHRIAQSNLTS